MKKKRKKLELLVAEPDTMAGAYLLRKYRTKLKELRLIRFNERWMIWKKVRYEIISDEFFRAISRSWLVKQHLKRYSRSGELVDAVCSIRIVNEVLDALIAMVALSTEETGFFWIDEDKALASSESIVTFENGILDVSRMRLLKHTPNWFATSILPYSFDPKAKCRAWKHWLKTISGDDKDWQQCLQLWFGYVLSPDTSRQRFAHFFGPPRTGKGTATRILGAILGRWNCASPTLTQLGNSPFALGSMVGKLAAMIPDAVIGRSVDSKAVMEILSSVIGEDLVDVNRKYMPTLSAVHMKVRFTVTSNEPLKWPDPTNKLSARCIVFPFINTYAGKEDPEIEKKLMAELPGIANWALAGLRKLKAGQALREPICGREKHKLFSDLDSPILLFSRRCLIETDNVSKSGRTVGIPVSHIHKIWMSWSREEGRSTKGQTRTYVRSLILNVFPHILVKRRGKRNRQEPHYIGLRLTKEGNRILRQAERRRRSVGDFKKSLGL